MIDKSFIEKIESMSAAEIKEINGRQYSTKPLHLIKAPSVTPIQIRTLTGFIDYIKNNQDDLVLNQCFAVVTSATGVSFVNTLDEDCNDRDVFLIAHHDGINHHFGRYLPIEEFILWLLTGFEKTESRDQVLDFVSNVKHEFVSQNQDNGITQTVSVKAGIARIGEKPVPSPVNLKPFRTFSEVEQPESLFILRAKKIGDEINFMLAEADGGAWEHKGILSIRDYIKKRLPEVVVIA